MTLSLAAGSSIAKRPPCTFQSIPLPKTSYPHEAIHEQGSGLLNEDQLLIQNNIYAVFDGASSLVGNTWLGKSGAWWAAKCAVNTLSQEENIYQDHSLSQLFAKANQHIAEKMEQAGINRKNRLGLWSCTGAAIRLYPDFMEYAQIGDSLILCIRNDGSYFLPAPYHNHDHKTLSAWQALAKQGCNDIHNTLSSQIIKTRLEMNRTFGVLNGERQMTNFLKSGSFSVKGIKAVLIFTDGLHWPSEQLSDKEDFAPLVKYYLKSGLSGLHQAVRKLEKEDPHCHRYPRFKQHDDIAAIALTFTNYHKPAYRHEKLC